MDSVSRKSLKGTGIDCYMTGGNDDLLEVESVLRSSDYIKDPEGQVVDVAGYEMISCGYSNPTPWRTPRELPEDELLHLIDSMAVQVKNMDRAIFNLHVPPFRFDIRHGTQAGHCRLSAKTSSCWHSGSHGACREHSSSQGHRKVFSADWITRTHPRVQRSSENWSHTLFQSRK